MLSSERGILRINILEIVTLFEIYWCIRKRHHYYSISIGTEQDLAHGLITQALKCSGRQLITKYNNYASLPQLHYLVITTTNSMSMGIHIHRQSNLSLTITLWITGPPSTDYASYHLRGQCSCTAPPTGDGPPSPGCIMGICIKCDMFLTSVHLCITFLNLHDRTNSWTSPSDRRGSTDTHQTHPEHTAHAGILSMGSTL